MPDFDITIWKKRENSARKVEEEFTFKTINHKNSKFPFHSYHWFHNTKIIFLYNQTKNVPIDKNNLMQNSHIPIGEKKLQVFHCVPLHPTPLSTFLNPCFEGTKNWKNWRHIDSGERYSESPPSMNYLCK